MPVGPYVHYVVTDRRRSVAQLAQRNAGQKLEFIRSGQDNNIALIWNDRCQVIVLSYST